MSITELYPYKVALLDYVLWKGLRPGQEFLTTKELGTRWFYFKTKEEADDFASANAAYALKLDGQVENVNNQ